MHGILVVALLAAAPPPIKVAAPSLNFVNIDAASGGLYLDYFAQQLSLQPGFQVTTRSQLEGVLGLERQKALMGCADTGCAVELMGALGVDVVLTGSLGKAGKGFVLNLSIVSAKDAKALAVHSSRPANEDALYDALAQFAKSGAEQVRVALGRPLEKTEAPVTVVEPLPPPPSAGTSANKAWIPVAAFTGVLTAGAITTFVLASGEKKSLDDGTVTASTREDVSAVRRRGETEQAMAIAFTASAGLALGSTAALLFGPDSSTYRAAVLFGAGGAALVSGIVLYALAAVDRGALEAGQGVGTLTDLENLRARGEARQAAGLTMGAVGLVGIAAGVIALLPGSKPSVSIAVIPGAALASFTGSF